jgi:hypothetical protein
MLLDLTYREIEEGMHKLEKEREKIEEEQVQREEPIKCTEAVDAPEGLTTKEAEYQGYKSGGYSPSADSEQPWAGGRDRLVDHHIKSMDIKVHQQECR